VLERDCLWRGGFETEPYEAAWAAEAIFYVRTLAGSGPVGNARARVQISPDGIHWCDEGTDVEVSGNAGTTFGRVLHFGHYLRLKGDLPASAEVRVMVYLSLKE